MRGVIKLQIGRRIIETEHFHSTYHRDTLISDWKEDHGLKKIRYKLLITPDHEEIERAYYTERAKGVYRGRFKCETKPHCKTTIPIEDETDDLRNGTEQKQLLQDCEG